jgi:adenosine 3'-phospho 5'-phosphosulfate transporter B2
MLMGKLLTGKTYPWQDYAMSVLVMAGLAVYKAAESEVATQGHVSGGHSSFTVGALLLFGYVLCDSFTGQWQGKVFREHGISSFQMMLGINSFSSVIALSMLLFNGALSLCLSPTHTP